MTDIQNEIKQVFDTLSAVPVSGDNVDLMAIARAHLRKAYKLAESAEQAKKEDTDDGGQSDQ